MTEKAIKELFIGKVAGILGFNKTIELLKEATDTINNVLQKYYQVKTDKDLRFFNKVKCNVRDSNNQEWINGYRLVMYNKNDVCSYTVVGKDGIRQYYHQCKILAFDKDNQPPVDTVVKINNIKGHFKEFSDDGVRCFIDKRTSKTEQDTIEWTSFEFIGFPESDFEEYKQS